VPEPRPRVLLVHGAATTARCWAAVAALLPDLAVTAPDRPCTGDLDLELAALAGAAEGALVVGVSGGATLGLALAATGVRLRGALLHEPAAGSLVPGLLGPVAAAHARGGVAAFGTALYGPAWTPSMAPADPGAVARDLALFRGFEPAPPHPEQGPVVVSTGEASPPVRHEVATALSERFGVARRVLPGCGHFVQQEHPAVLAQAVRGLLEELREL
jgi:pimeloyl-ACP methyl ester carboxylesterase